MKQQGDFKPPSSNLIGQFVAAVAVTSDQDDTDVKQTVLIAYPNNERGRCSHGTPLPCLLWPGRMATECRGYSRSDPDRH